MSIVLEDSNLNVAEQVNVLFKSSLGFPSTKESTPWFQETSVKYNNYVNGEEILLDEIPSNPSFSVTPNIVDVNVSSSQLATGGYIKEDSTGVIRQYHRLILTPVPNSSNNSYYALDSEGNNILTDGLQFNTKWSGSGDKIYPYTLYTEAFISADSSAPNELGQDSTGGNWLYDLKNGVIFFPDYSSSLCNGTTNKPVFSFYKYIGRKGVSKQIDFKNSLLDISNTTKKYDKQIVVQTSDNTIHRYDSATTSWIPIGGSGGGSVWEESSSNTNIFYNSSGSVGIGTDNPQAKLHIAHAEGVSEDIISLRAEGTIRTYAPDADSHIRSEITSHHQGGKLLLYDGYSNTNTNEIQVQLSAKINEYNYINNGGRVGIGITVPQAVLHVAQKNAVWNATSNPDPVTLRVEGGILVTDVDADIHHRVKIESDGQILIYGGNSPNETANVKISGNSSENNDGITYFNAGRVGIGTDTPLGTLHLNISEQYENGLYISSSHSTYGSNTSGGVFFFNVYNHPTSTKRGLILQERGTDNTWKRNVLMVQRGTGAVGIGTNLPKAKLHIEGAYYTDAYVGSQTFRYFVNNSEVTQSSAADFGSRHWGLYCKEDALFDYHLFIASDKRIKENIVEIDDDVALQKLRDISCCWYNYKDKAKRGDAKVLGFIAQQVNEHLPEAVTTKEHIIPNEMKVLTDVSWNNTTMITNELQDVSGTKYRFYVSDDLSSNELIMDIVGNADNHFEFEKQWKYVYCYGKEVNDFHTLDKQKLFALNFSATQEIDRIQQQQILDISQNKVCIESLKIENDNLKLQNSTLTTKVNNLQSELTNLKSIVQGLIEAQMSS